MKESPLEKASCEKIEIRPPDKKRAQERPLHPGGTRAPARVFGCQFGAKMRQDCPNPISSQLQWVAVNFGKDDTQPPAAPRSQSLRGAPLC